MTVNFEPLSEELCAHLMLKLPGEIRVLLTRFPGKLFIYGGCVSSIITGDSPSDVDCCCASEDDLLAIVQFLGRSTRVEQGRHTYTTHFGGLLIQFRQRSFSRSIEEVLDMSDFTISRSCLTCDARDGKIKCFVDNDFYADLSLRRLRYGKNKREANSTGALVRALKYSKRGYSLDFESYELLLAGFVEEVMEKVMDDTQDAVLARRQFVRKRLLELLPDDYFGIPSKLL